MPELTIKYPNRLLGVTRREISEEQAKEVIDLVDGTDEDENTATCPVDGETYDREWDLDHEEHDSTHPNHYKFCDIAEAHEHEEG